jgi:hypothetical protein
MEETTIECPSCSRRIRIPLRRRLSCFEITQNFDDLPVCPESKEYDIRDVLWINDELAKENEKLRGVIKHLEIVAYG